MRNHRTVIRTKLQARIKYLHVVLAEFDTQGFSQAPVCTHTTRHYQGFMSGGFQSAARFTHQRIDNRFLERLRYIGARRFTQSTLRFQLSDDEHDRRLQTTKTKIQT